MEPIRIELPTDFTVGPVNAYLFTEPEPILIDTGVKTEASWTALQEGLAKLGLDVQDLVKVIITHPHVDHFGQAGMIAAQSDAQVWVSTLGKPWLLDFPLMWQKRIEYYQNTFMGPTGFHTETIEIVLNYMGAIVAICDAIPADRLVTFEIGDTLNMGGLAWQVLHMPGHANHQTCFYQRETRQFLSADMLLSKTPTPIVERPPAGTKRIPSLPLFLESLKLVETLDIDTVYPGHGEPFGKHRQVIRHQRDRIETRKTECYQLVSSGKSTVAELVDTMYSHIPVQFRFAGLWMLVGYLDLLKSDGLIVEKMVNGVWHYERA